MTEEGDSADDDIDALFAQTRRGLDEAEATLDPGSLAGVAATIDRLAILMRERSARAEAQAEAMRAATRVWERLCARPAPADPTAAARIAAAIAALGNPAAAAAPPAFVPVSAAVETLIDDGDTARAQWEAADIAHRARPFDRAERTRFESALEAYAQAEDGLAATLEGACPATIGVPPTDPAETREAEDASPRASDDDDERDLPPVHEGNPPPATPAGEQPFVAPFDDELLDTSTEVQEPARPPERTEIDEPPPSADAEPEDSATPTGDGSEADTAAMPASATDIATVFLDRGDIGLFELSCVTGRELNHRLPPPQLAHLVGLSGVPGAESEFLFSQALEAMQTAAEHELFTQGERWLLMAALSLPAVTDPTRLARSVLEHLKLDDALDGDGKTLQSAILALDRAYPSLPALASSTVPEGDQELKSALAELAAYAAQVQSSSLAYQAATQVARRLAQAYDKASRAPLDPDAVERALGAVIGTDESDAALIQRLDREGRGATADRKPIEARALKRLKEIVGDFRARVASARKAAELLREQRKADAHSNSATHRKGRELRHHFQEAAEWFADVAEGRQDVDAYLSACAKVAARLLGAHELALSSGVSSNPFAQALQYDRFRVSSAGRQPLDIPELTWAALVDLAGRAKMSWLDAFDEAMRAQEHVATGMLLHLAGPLANDRALPSERDEAIVAARNQVEAERKKLGEDLLTVMNYAPAGETSLDPLYQGVAQIDVKELPKLDAVSENAAGITDFPDAFAEIQAARERLNKARTSALEALKLRIDRLVGIASSDTIAALRKLVDDDELITLAEELTLVERGQEIRVAAAGPGVLGDFSRFLEATRSVTLLADWERLQHFSDGSREKALIRRWMTIGSPRGDTKRAVRDALSELGFVPERDDPVTPVGPRAHMRIQQFEARFKTIADRDVCSIARFGSEAGGQYRIVLTGRDPRANDIVGAVPEGNTGATLVLVGKWLSPEERLAIATEARRLGRAFCLVDDGLIAFLSRSQRVLHDLFACGIPFAAATPYTTTPGSIPVEAFFGRETELKDIQSVDGMRPGGRRFGALVHALLAMAQLDAQRPEIERLVAVQGRLVGASPEEVSAAVSAVQRTLAHPLLRRAAGVDTAKVHRETPIMLTLDDGAILEGVVDLAFEEGDGSFQGWTIVDFKTAREVSTESVPGDHVRQVALYCKAIAAATKSPARGIVLVV